MASSSTPPSPPPPPPLPDDLIPGILLRIPPDDPAALIRASTVCKSWRRIITNPTFPNHYHTLHPTAPILGFLHNPTTTTNRSLPRFVSTTSFRPAAADHHQCHALDCRHGRAVLYDYGSLHSFVVWDPITGAQHKLPDVLDVFTHAAVVCTAGAAAACVDDGHRRCSAGGGGPFIVAFVGVENMPQSYYFDAHACFYASDTGGWSVHLNIHLDHGRYYPDDRPAVLLGDTLYFYCRRGILRYRYGLLRGVPGQDIISAGIRERDVLSMVDLPREKRLGIGNGRNRNVVVMAAEGGGLGLACLCPETGTLLYLWAREETGSIVGDEAAAAAGRLWVQRRVIDLKMLLPVGNLKMQPCLSGVAQEANVVFVSTEDGVFTIEIGSSVQARKVCELGGVVKCVYPFVSFYTESLLLKLARGNKLPAPEGNQ